jgi:hypothetical protein
MFYDTAATAFERSMQYPSRVTANTNHPLEYPLYILLVNTRLMPIALHFVLLQRRIYCSLIFTLRKWLTDYTYGNKWRTLCNVTQRVTNNCSCSQEIPLLVWALLFIVVIQEPVTTPHYEPAESTQHSHSTFLEDQF